MPTQLGELNAPTLALTKRVNPFPVRSHPLIRIRGGLLLRRQVPSNFESVTPRKGHLDLPTWRCAESLTTPRVVGGLAQFGNTALHWAVAGGFLDVAELLVTEGEAPLNVANEVRRTLSRSRPPALPPLPLIARAPRGRSAVHPDDAAALGRCGRQHGDGAAAAAQRRQH